MTSCGVETAVFASPAKTRSQSDQVRITCQWNGHSWKLVKGWRLEQHSLEKQKESENSFEKRKETKQQTDGKIA